jgi:hypothetical protein
MFEDEALLMKRGEICIQVTFQRGRIPGDKPGAGLIVEAKIHPLVEETIASFGGGDTVDVRTTGRHWTSGDKNNPLLAYDLTSPAVSGVLGSGKDLYLLDAPGQPLLGDGQRTSNEVVNLSFLRLKGLSEGAGMKFFVRGVFTLEQVRNIADKVQNASRSFYVSYMKPVGVTIMVSTQELGG